MNHRERLEHELEELERELDTTFLAPAKQDILAEINEIERELFRLGGEAHV